MNVFSTSGDDVAVSRLSVPTRRGVVLNGALFRRSEGAAADTVMICITGIHGNFFSNPFYFNIGETLARAGFDFIYAQTNDAFPDIDTLNVNTGKRELIGSWNERFAYTDDDIDAYLALAVRLGYRRVVLAGHSLGANKVIYYLSRNRDARVDRFFLLSPANVAHMLSGVPEEQRAFVKRMVGRGNGDKVLPFALMGWVRCQAHTAHDWLFDNILDNVHSSRDTDFSQVGRVEHMGAMLVGTYDRFTNGAPADFLRNINAHMPTADQNRLIFIERTGHTYQKKEQEVADAILATLRGFYGGGDAR